MCSDQSPVYDLTTRTAFAFRSAKARAPIQATSAFAHVALVVATLDPAVRSIVHPTLENATADLIMVDGDLVRLLVDEDGAATADWSTARRAGYRIVSRNDDPVFVRAVLVWACRRRHVTYDNQIAIKSFLRECGPTPLDALCDLVTSYIEPIPAILGLACRDVVEIDLREAPGPDMTVRLRERASER